VFKSFDIITELFFISTRNHQCLHPHVIKKNLWGRKHGEHSLLTEGQGGMKEQRSAQGTAGYEYPLSHRQTKDLKLLRHGRKEIVQS
jgi:hypothetical protein